jgi:hypothetical protein
MRGVGRTTQEVRVPADSSVVLARDLLHYTATGATLLIGLARIGLHAKKRTTRGPLSGTFAGDAAWFVPVYVWGIESLRHLTWWLLGGEFFPYPPSFLQHGEFTIAILAFVAAACLAEEYLAKRTGLPARQACGTIPVPTMAAIVGVLAVWFICSVMWMSIR